MRIAVYISGHGFGHLAQIAPVLEGLMCRCPDGRFLVRCALPEAELRTRLPFAFELDPGPVDVGVVQRHAVAEDRSASIRAMREWCTGLARHIDREVQRLRGFRPHLVLSNISPLAFPVARRLGVPGLGLATLDWHTIYRHWLPADDPVIETLAASYGACDELLVPPMAMAMDVFPRRRPIPLVASGPQRSIRLDDPRYKALVLFGGSASPPYEASALAELADWLFLVPGATGSEPENIRPVPAGAAPVDVMPSVDCIVCKPGYGVLSEGWRTGTPLVWIERPGFPEYPVLERWLENRFPATRLDMADFAAGRWGAALERARNDRRRYPEIAGDGAAEAAAVIASWVGR